LGQGFIINIQRLSIYLLNNSGPMLSWQVLYHLSHTQVWLATFQIGSCTYSQAILQSSYLCLLCNWNYRQVTPHLACLLRCSLANFLPGLAMDYDLPDL
jgi:hypothetical protein